MSQFTLNYDMSSISLLCLKMKTVNLPWKSRLFTYGVVTLLFSLIGAISEFASLEPELNDFHVASGEIEKIEKWRLKNKFGTDIYLNTGKLNRFSTSSYCEPTLIKLSAGENITIHYTEAGDLSRVIGNVKHISRNSEIVCSYNELLKYRDKNQVIRQSAPILLFLVAISMIVFGYKKHNKVVKRDK